MTPREAWNAWKRAEHAAILYRSAVAGTGRTHPGALMEMARLDREAERARAGFADVLRRCA